MITSGPTWDACSFIYKKNVLDECPTHFNFFATYHDTLLHQTGANRYILLIAFEVVLEVHQKNLILFIHVLLIPYIDIEVMSYNL